MRRRWFLDPFAGPGLNVNPRDRTEFPGSPIRAITTVGSVHAESTFTDAVFVNLHRGDHTALKTRIERACSDGRSKIPLPRIRLINDDANVVLPDVMSAIPPLDYVFAFVDITGLKHWPFSSVQDLKRLGHKSVDMYMLFPLEIALQRHMSYERDMTERYAHDFDAFFGSDEWRPIYERRRTRAESPALKRELTALYIAKLKTLWDHVEVQDTHGISPNQRLYRMIFATSNPIASRLANWERGVGQYDLQL